MSDLLLELFSEEIPARMQKDAQKYLLSGVQAGLGNAGYDTLKTDMGWFSTPRRITYWAKDLIVELPATKTELKGPKIGAPEAALEGFLKKNNLGKNDLVERDGVYFAAIHKEGRKTSDILKEIIEDILKNFPWPKSMRWGAGEVTWVRPLHSILCIFDGKIVPVEFGGIKAGNVTYGHRFLSPEKITITDPAEYEAKLEKTHVIADREKRKAEILKQAEKVAATQNLLLKKDDGLLDEVTGLVEWPVVLMGTIDSNFMDLPWQVLVSEMRTHQKYFALETGDGVFANKFLITANMETGDGGKAIIAGNERVLRARLSDARFFWDQDRKKPLGVWAEGLKKVTFHVKLGTVADKVERVKTLALQLSEYVKADKKLAARAAELCKADLVTGMVGEFPELQGVMGGYYAELQGEDKQVSGAIRDHYKPQGPNDSVPAQPVSICVALADKLDTLVSMFAIGEKPTGSKDPFALRRAALGVIRIILENNLRIPLSLPLSRKREREAAANAAAGEGDLLTFIIDRLKVQLKDSGIRHDVINAVVADGDDDLVRIVARARAVQDFIGTDDGKNLLAGYKRAANILAIEEKKDKILYMASGLQPIALKEAAEKELVDVLSKQSAHIENLRAKEQFVESMQLLAGLRGAVDLFFDKIMVNCDDKELRSNRLRLLASIRDSMDGVARFSAVEG